jgi:hypothetical protein
MSSWGKTDASTSAPLWALLQLKKEPTLNNVQNLFESKIPNAYISGTTIGLFNYASGETQSSAIAHTGWVLKTAFTGGRADRVQYETLAVLTSNS